MGFDGLHADIEFIGNLLVQLAGNDQLHDLALALRQLVEPAGDGVVALLAGGDLAVEFKGAFDAGEQVFVMEGLFDEVAGAALQRPDRHRHVAVTGDENDGQMRTDAVELFLQFQAAHFRHAHVEDDAAAQAAAPGAEEGGGRVEAGDLVTLAFKQPGHRVEHGFVVVNDVDDLLWRGHCSSSIGTVKRKAVPPS